jgi:hypothetical protein
MYADGPRGEPPRDHWVEYTSPYLPTTRAQDDKGGNGLDKLVEGWAGEEVDMAINLEECSHWAPR